MTEKTNYKRGIYKSIGSDENLESYTSDGWLLAAVLSATETKWFLETVPNPRYGTVNPNGCCESETLNMDREQPVPCLKFLLWKDEDSLLVERKEKIKKLEKEAYDLRQDNKTLKDNLCVEEGSTENLRKALKSVEQEQEGFRTIKGRMEKDLGKVREAIGTQRMKEILEESNDK